MAFAMATGTVAERAIRRHLLVGLVMVGVMAVGAGGWAVATPLASALIANGTLVVDSYVKKVQHPSGGIVSILRVKNGDHVEAGDILIRLDQTQTRANLAIVEKRLIELEARRVRLIAERDEAKDVPFDAAFGNQIEKPLVAEAVAGEAKLFAARRASRDGQTAQLKERVEQLDQEVGGLEAQVLGKDQEIGLINKELTGVRQLLNKGLTQLTRVNSLEREAARLTGERGNLTASIAQTKGKITETNLQILQVDDDLQTEVEKELREIEGTIGEFEERRVTAEDQLKRVDIRAPQAGIVHELSVHTTDAVIAPGETVMLIVPAADRLEAEVKIAPQDIDQLGLGQEVQLHFSAFNQRTTPTLAGTVQRIGADLTRDPQSGQTYFLARVAVTSEEIAKLGSLKLLPGMPVEAFVQTGERTALSYLVKPLSDQIERAFKEN